MEEQFIRDNLEECYIRIIEDTLLLRPLCGLLKKYDTARSERIARLQQLVIQKDEEIKQLRAHIYWIEKPKAQTIRKVNGNINLYKIKDIVEAYFEKKIDTDTRKAETCYARQMAMYYAKKLTKEPLRIIGENMAGRDHATVLHDCKTIVERSVYPDTARHLKELNEIFGIT